MSGCATDPLLTIAPSYGHPTDLAFAPDNRLWATMENGRVQSWQIPSGEPGPSFQDAAFWNIAISPNGKFAALIQRGGVQLRDLNTHERVALLEADAGISSLRFSPDSSLLVGTCLNGSETTPAIKPVFVWKVPSGELVQRFDQHTEPVHEAVFSSDGRYVFSAGEEVVDSWTHTLVYQWEVATGKITASFKGPVGWPVGVGLTPDGRKLIVGDEHGRVLVWEMGKQQPIQDAKIAGTSWQMALSPDGRLAAMASGSTTAIPPIPFIWVAWPNVPAAQFNNKVYLYDVQAGRRKGELGGSNVVRRVAIAHDGQYIASLDDSGHIRIYELSD